MLIGDCEMSAQYIIISGNIGSGKTTLAKLLSERLNVDVIYEPLEKNPYIYDFYVDMQRWCFNSQVSFLSNQVSQHIHCAKKEGFLIKDSSIYESVEVFGRNLYQLGIMSNNDWNTYFQLYKLLRSVISPPIAIIYLKCPIPILIERIKGRDREFEKNISIDYLNQLDTLYDRWVSNIEDCPIIELSANQLKYIEYPNLLDNIVHLLFERGVQVFN